MAEYAGFEAEMAAQGGQPVCPAVGIFAHDAGLFAGLAERRAEHQCPGKDADVVGIGQCLNRIRHQVHQQVAHHFADAGGRFIAGCFHAAEQELRRE